MAALVAGLYSTFSLGVVAFVYFSILSVTEATVNGGFTIDLIHRDTPLSPFYNPLETPSQRLRNAIRRSTSRINRFRSSTSVSPNTPQAQVKSTGDGEFVMKATIGTPPVDFLAIVDTGSDLIWTQCKPCSECYDQTLPMFDPQNSTTYRTISCESKRCKKMPHHFCDSGNNSCGYSYRYGDQSYTQGLLATETLNLGSTSGRSVALPKIVFGCGHDNFGTFSKKTSGLVGLGGGSESLVSQMGSSIRGKFSYCLIPLSTLHSNRSSKLNFGSNGVVSGSGVVSTSLVAKEPDTFYYLTMEGISVGEKRIDSSHLKSKAALAEEGNIIIDSGTTLMYLSPDIYSRVESAVRKAIDIEPVEGPEEILELCYRTETEIDVPTITVHFTGADVKLEPSNTFVRIEDLLCFTMVSGADGDPSIFGNLAQTNFLIGYDLEARTVSFLPADCIKH